MKAIACPICRRPVESGAPDFPFCSERCRDIDLGNWAAEQYRIPPQPASQPGESEDGDG
jgi:endogenous inhibitor of DNA gyrase (YacG/DUF329 family)